jgi:nitroreductase
MELIHDNIEKAIHRSQHCQRNWDLSKEIPQDDLDLILTSVTQCPSKQNIAHYKVHAITNRDLINSIHDNTQGFAVSYEPYKAETNSQVLANLLLVFEAQGVNVANDSIAVRNDETLMLSQKGKLTAEAMALLTRDRHMAVGIAAGYCNMTSSLLGYGTGCCACFDGGAIQKILGIDGEILLMMGVGFKNPDLNRRIHHTNHSFMFPTKSKQPIEVTYHK